jgi:alpha-tubulin suppressor-like RCC1 family protein
VVHGTGFTAVLKSDGTVWTSGINGNGQLGQGDVTQKTSFGQVQINQNAGEEENKEPKYLTDIVDIASRKYPYACIRQKWNSMGMGNKCKWTASGMEQVKDKDFLQIR